MEQLLKVSIEWKISRLTKKASARFPRSFVPVVLPMKLWWLGEREVLFIVYAVLQVQNCHLVLYSTTATATIQSHQLYKISVWAWNLIWIRLPSVGLMRMLEKIPCPSSFILPLSCVECKLYLQSYFTLSHLSIYPSCYYGANWHNLLVCRYRETLESVPSCTCLFHLGTRIFWAPKFSVCLVCVGLPFVGTFLRVRLLFTEH